MNQQLSKMASKFLMDSLQSTTTAVRNQDFQHFTEFLKYGMANAAESIPYQCESDEQIQEVLNQAELMLKEMLSEMEIIRNSTFK